ncbi:MAG TPA: ATP-binding protein [Candidatus Manganitrophaceae bacterium]|nr:ATP-binding protein [Candidatus Manganitrophaceae bacterium]
MKPEEGEMKPEEGGTPGRTDIDHRLRVEARLREKMAGAPKTKLPDPVERLIQELETYQVELEIQNEELREAQAALQASQSRYADLYDFAPVGYLTLDRDGIILEANLAAAEMFGLEKERFIGKPFFLFVEKESRDLFHLHLRAVFQRRSRRRSEIRIKKSGRKKVESASFFAELESIHSEGPQGEARCRTVLRDVTERKRAEDLLRHQAEELEKAGRIKDEFLAVLSHELRTPLNSILGWTSLLREQELDEPAVAKALETIQRNARAQNRLIEDMFDVSRIIMGRLRLEVNEIEFIRVIQAAADSIRPAAEANKIELVLDLDPSANRLRGDLNRLQQVVWNLLSNAVKFTPSGGRVDVRLERIDAHVALQVRDNGQGIDPAFLPYVFDRFRQGDSAAGRSHGGLGLGLSIVRNLVELHGGTVRAESLGKGKGAAFIVLLPAERSLEPEEETGPESLAEAMEAYPALDDVKVLVIDDEADARDLIQSTLERCNATVTTAGSAREALERFGRSRPDVAIIDIGMPEEDGYVLMRKLRALEEKGKQVAAVALTAYAREQDRALALLSGYQMHLSKPIEPRKIAWIVAALVGRGISS